MTAHGAGGRERWAAAFAEAQAKGLVRDADFTTISGLEVDPVYGPDEENADERMERIGWPGEFPFTRGLYPSGYRGRPWTIRQFAGFGNAEQTNERYKMILAAGGGGGGAASRELGTGPAAGSAGSGPSRVRPNRSTSACSAHWRAGAASLTSRIA